MGNGPYIEIKPNFFGDVINVRDCVFYHNQNISSIEFSENIEIIGREAMKYCSNLHTVKIPKSVRSIGNATGTGSNTFYCINPNNEAMTRLIIPDNVISLDYSGDIIAGYSKLSKIYFPTLYTSGMVATYNLRKTIYISRCTSLKEVVIQNNFLNPQLRISESTAFESQDLVFIIGRFNTDSTNAQSIIMGSTNLSKLTDIYVQSYSDYLTDGGERLYDWRAYDLEYAGGKMEDYEYLATDLIVCESTATNANLVTTIAAARGITLS